VLVDGQAVGRTPLTLRDLAPGQHLVVLTLGGRVTATRSVELRPGGAHEVVVVLEPETPVQVAKPEPQEKKAQPPERLRLRPPVEPEGHPGRTAKVLALSAVMAAVLASVAAVVTWQSYINLENKTHDQLVTLQGLVTTNEPSMANNPWFNDPLKNMPTCTTPFDGDANAAISNQAASYRSQCNRGQTYALVTSGLWIGVGALAAIGVTSFIVGERQASHADTKREAWLKRSLRLLPTVSAHGGGLQLGLQF
jgi:hypothetical protein